MLKNITIRALACCFALCGLLCGCGTQTDGLVLVGENAVDGGEGSAVRAGSDGMAGSADGESDFEGGERSSAEERLIPEDAPEQVPRIYVHVCGAVNCPGVVVLQEGSRAEDALEAAGGFRQDAGRDYVNLAARVSDGEKLYFPTEEEAAGLWKESREESGTDGLIDINTADAAALCTLPGIGEAKAEDILRYREENGPFECIEDIMKVPGIKESVYGKIRDRIRTGM